MNQTRAEEITMREDYGNINLDTVDDGFGEQVRDKYRIQHMYNDKMT